MTASGQKGQFLSLWLKSNHLLLNRVRDFHLSQELVNVKTFAGCRDIPQERFGVEDFAAFFHCFSANKLLFLFNGLEFRVVDFFIVCRILRASFLVQTVLQNSYKGYQM